MSLVSSYIKCKDGRFYRDLCYWAPDLSWYICFDDDDPVELVMKEDLDRTPRSILNEVGIPFTSIGKPSRGSHRVFSGNMLEKLAPAVSHFILVRNEPFPTPRSSDTYDESYDESPACQGVYYGGI